MNLALPAALILLLVLPGFIFVYAYKGRLRPHNDALVSNSSMTLASILGLLGALLAHAIWVPIANEALSLLSKPIRVDIDSVAYLLAGEYKDGFEQRAAAFTRYPYAVGLYFLSLYILCTFLGIVAHRIVRRCKLDRKIEFLRFNKWHYLFSGEGDGFSGVLITASCKHNNHTSLYTGVLKSYDFNADGQLELLVLISAGRAELPASPSNNAPVFQPIAGDRFVLWCKDVNTLNIDYLYGKRIPPASPQTAPSLPTAPSSAQNDPSPPKPAP